MEKLTTEQIEDIVDDLINFDFLPVGRDGREPYEQLCKGAEQMRDELLAYRQLEEEIGCPLEVRCQLYNGMRIYDKNGEEFVIRFITEYGWLNCEMAKYYDKGEETEAFSFSVDYYKKTWWTKPDRSE